MMSRDKFYEIFMMVLAFIFSIATCIWGFTWADSIFTYSAVILLSASTAYFGYCTGVVIVDAVKEIRTERAFERTCSKCKDFEKHKRGECYIEYTTGLCFTTEKEKNK